MADSLPYRRSYKKKSLDKAYRQFVDGTASLRKLTKSSGVSFSTLCRHSAKDEWVAEMEERKGKALAAASLLTQMAAVTAEVDASPGGAVMGAREAIIAVLKRQQQFWDRVESRVASIFDEIEQRAADTKRPVQLGQIIPLLTAAEKASSNVRKAYGIPDATKLDVLFRDVSDMTEVEIDSELARMEVEEARTAQAASTTSKVVN